MKLILKNTTNTLLWIRDIDIHIEPNNELSIDTGIKPLNSSRDLLKEISNGNIIVNNYERDLLPTECIKFITTNNLYPLDSEGKLFVHQTSKSLGTTTYWAGKGDSPSDVYDIGNGQEFVLNNKPGDPMSNSIYVDFNTIDNKTDMHEGYIVWDNAKYGDTISLSTVVNTVNVQPGTNTNYNLYGGFLVIPAAGNGNIELLSDITNPCISGGSLVQVYTNEYGYRPRAYWNATYNKQSRKFESITPAPNGDGEFNMYTFELVGERFVNSVPLIGSGSRRLQSSDSTFFPHGIRLKMEITSTNDDHDWSVGGILTLHRQKTYRNF